MPLGPSWALLGASWSLLGALEGLLERLVGQDRPRARGIRVFSLFWDRFRLIFEMFLDGFWDDFSTLILHYPTRPQHVEKPKKYLFSSTGRPFEVLQVQYLQVL